MIRRVVVAALALAAFGALVPSRAVPAAGTIMLGRQFLPPVDVAETSNGATFRNLDAVKHTASYPADCIADCIWDTGPMRANDVVTLDIPPGTYEYWCQYHPAMRATLVVLG